MLFFKRAVTSEKSDPPFEVRKSVSLAPDKPKLLVLVIPKAKEDYYSDVLFSFEANLLLTFTAEGTADSEMRGLLGLSDNEKIVMVAVIRSDMSKNLLQTLEEKFLTVRNGKGIAYTVPLDSTIGVMTYRFLCNRPAEDRRNEHV